MESARSEAVKAPGMGPVHAHGFKAFPLISTSHLPFPSRSEKCGVPESCEPGEESFVFSWCWGGILCHPRKYGVLSELLTSGSWVMQLPTKVCRHSVSGSCWRLSLLVFLLQVPQESWVGSDRSKSSQMSWTSFRSLFQVGTDSLLLLSPGFVWRSSRA